MKRHIVVELKPKTNSFMRMLQKNPIKVQRLFEHENLRYIKRLYNKKIDIKSFSC